MDRKDLATTAKYVRSLGIHIFAVGVGRANTKELGVNDI